MHDSIRQVMGPGWRSDLVVTILQEQHLAGPMVVRNSLAKQLTKQCIRVWVRVTAVRLVSYRFEETNLMPLLPIVSGIYKYY